MRVIVSKRKTWRPGWKKTVVIPNESFARGTILQACTRLTMVDSYAETVTSTTNPVTD